MAPKYKFTREEIVQAALSIIREKGGDGLTARALASELNCSAKPIFGLFSGMEEVHRAACAAAQDLFGRFMSEDMAKGMYPPYKASGMAYIRFAREERELFKLLFMRDRSGESAEEGHSELDPIIEIIRENLGLSKDEAFKFHLEMWIFTHGIATMIATGYLNWEEKAVSDGLSDVYQGLRRRFTEGK